MTNQTIEQRIIAAELTFTFNPNEAIYITPGGQLVSGAFYDGCRTEDHRCMELLSTYDRYDKEFWPEVFLSFNLVMIVPECRQLYTMDGQPLTQKQLSRINHYLTRLHYTLEVFS